MERLDKLLAGTGRWSRKEVKELVRTGRVFVNGVRAAKPEDKFDPNDTFEVSGETVCCAGKLYLMLNKPAGYVSATEDASQQTVLDLLPEHLRKVGLFPAGRLDKDTEGLLLLTNDGPLAHELLAPKKHVDKVYYAKVDGMLDEEDVKSFAEGLTLQDGLTCLSAGLEILEQKNECLVTLQEGKYHQVKRMLASRGKPVLYLKRLTMGPLCLDQKLAPGQWRELTADEKKMLGRL